MRSGIFKGVVEHQRNAPVLHRFSYPVYAGLFDVDELALLARTVRWFGYNRPAPISLYDSDYLPGFSGSLAARIRTVLADHCAGAEFPRIELLTVPRMLLPVFNPVSFYCCYTSDDRLGALVAEVNNTFSETHLYVLREPVGSTRPGITAYAAGKQFHVSPFNDMQGQYRFYVERESESCSIRVHIVREGRAVFTSVVAGQVQPFSALPAALPGMFWSAHAAFPRICWQAAKLRYGKGLRVHTKPIASSPMTIRAAGPGVLQRVCRSLVRRVLGGLRAGELTLRYPDGSCERYGSPGAAPAAVIDIRNYNFFVRTALGGDVGFAESYIEGHWECDDLTELLKLFVEHYEAGPHRPPLHSIAGRLRNIAGHRLRANGRLRSRKNVRAHYDLSNELFGAFLDRTMTYSCAKFSHAEQDLEEAQRAKLAAMIEKARITADDHVLEIGCGWGSFALEAARLTGCRVTGITLSEEQAAYSRSRVQQAGMEDRVQIRICDYRDIKGSFDKIVSIEMLEAVGHRYLGTFFRACDRLLKDDGLLALQVITIPDQRYGAYRKGCDFIQKYVFPGGHCPSLTALTDAISRHSRFVVEDLENIGVHYARTLAEWRKRFLCNLPALNQLGFDTRFERIWSYYFAYCEAAFALRTLGTLQLVLTRPNNRQLPPCAGY